MTVLNAEAGAISFAHLAGITAPVHAAKAEAPAKDDDDDDDKKDDAKASDDSDDANAEGDDDKKDMKAESDDSDDDEPKKDKAKKASTSGVARGVAQERARWTAVVGHRSFARNAALGAHMLANTAMDANAILSVLRDAPATASADAGRAARNPNLGASAPAPAVTTDHRWGAAFKRAGITK